ncbi:MAG: cytochrome c biogenesis protein [Planctomycetota bacterium]|jgi:ABC-type transport system involved in cytochrome c biogenesis permease subunit
MIHRLLSLVSAAGVIAAACLTGAPVAAADALSETRHVAVQDNGRVKPLEAFARESVRMVFKKEKWEREDPLVTLLRWSGASETVGESHYLLRVEHAELRAAIGVADAVYPKGHEREGQSRLLFAFEELRGNEAYWRLIESGSAKDRDDRKDEITTAERKAMELHPGFNRLGLILRGRLPRLIATPTGETGRWLAPAEVPPSGHPGSGAAAAWAQLSKAVADGADTTTLSRAMYDASRAVGAEHQGDPYVLSKEVHYFRFHPIGKALWFYGLGALVMLALLPVQKRWAPWVGAVPIVAAFLMHGYGMLIRVQISGRPPVTDMYESILWASWTVMLFAFILTAFLRVRAYILVGGAVSWVLLAFTGTGLMPLDPAISPLVPVLKNNFWLTIHVPIIVASYGAFALAWGLGYVAMGYAAFAPHQRDVVNKMSRYIYRAMQIGVLFLGAGTILGGVWAAESWGRYWGWDPKEVGALLAFLIYVAALHGRFAGWWHNFGLAVSAVMGFFGVLMAWIGVNILGAGLHAYGFAEGGMLPVVLVALFVGSLGFCIWAGLARKAALAKKPELAAAIQADIDAEYEEDEAPAAAKSGGTTDTGGPAVA